MNFGKSVKTGISHQPGENGYLDTCVWNALGISISIDVWLNVWTLMHMFGFGSVYELQPAWKLVLVKHD